MENGIKEYFKELGNNPINPLEIKSGNESIQFIGLNKREYFAGLAMQKFVAYSLKYGPAHISFEACAADSVKMADALLLELDKPKNEAE